MSLKRLKEKEIINYKGDDDKQEESKKEEPDRIENDDNEENNNNQFNEDEIIDTNFHRFSSVFADTGGT